MQKHSIGLSMIVKNEAHVIERLIKSVAPIIDYWVIVDTGSTDGTQKIIQDFFAEKGIPGELVDFEWCDNFSAARNVALEKVEPHVDYGFWIDADEEMSIHPSFSKAELFASNPDSVSIKTIYGKVDYTRKNIWKTGRGFSWNGPIHELLGTPDERSGVATDKLSVLIRPEGNSWVENGGDIKIKYSSHAKILEKYTYENPDPRWVFYTAQSYRDCQEHEKSIEWYTKRSKMEGGFTEEVYVSKLMIAKLSEILGKPKDVVTNLYQEAHSSDPLRAEALAGLIKYYHKVGDFEMAYIMSKHGLQYIGRNPYPHRILFLEKDVYLWIMLEIHALSCFYSGRKEEGSWAYWQMRAVTDTFAPGTLTDQQMAIIASNEQHFPRELVNQPIKPYPGPGINQSAQPKKVPAGAMSDASRAKARKKRKKRK